MVKTMIKKGIVLAMLSAMVLPFSVARASSADSLWENIANAQSMDLSMDLDLETKNDTMSEAKHVAVHVDIETDFANQTAFDFHALSPDANGTMEETDRSLIVTNDAMYFQSNDGEWSMFKMNSAPASEDEMQELADAMEMGMNELIAAGVIDYSAETLGVVNGTMAMRYAYTVNNDRLFAYLIDQGLITAATQDKARDFFSDLSISGNVWIGVAEMLPVMITMNARHAPSATAYTTVEISVLFKSFNEPISIDIPEVSDVVGNDALEESATMTMTSVVEKLDLDTDGDGLKDSDEHLVWHTDSWDTDTDGDGYPDYTEVINGYDPNGPGKLDSDGDGLTDYAEMTVHWTNRYDSDSDNDSYPDGLEIANGYNPNGLGRW